MSGIFRCYRCGSPQHLSRNCNAKMPEGYQGVIARGVDCRWWQNTKSNSELIPRHPNWFPGPMFKIANLPFRVAFQRSPTGKDFAAKIVFLCSSTMNNWRIVVRFPYDKEEEAHTIDASHPSVTIKPTDCITLMSGIVVLDIVGVPFGMKNFHKPPENSSADDVVALLIDNQRVFVTKSYLTTQSGVFRRMFHELATAETGQAKKAKREPPIELPLENIVAEHFVELLHVDLDNKPIDNDNVEMLMEVADKYEMQSMLDECEAFLVYNSKRESASSAHNIGGGESFFSIQKQLQFASQYQFDSLLNKAVNSLTSVEQIKSGVYGVHGRGRIDAKAESRYSKKVNSAVMNRLFRIV